MLQNEKSLKRVLKKPMKSCCASENINSHAHPDHGSVLPRLKKAQGQLLGIEKMIGERRYCVDILIQLKAASAAIKSIEAAVFEGHIRSCVQDAVLTKNKKDAEEKIEELVSLFLKA